MKKMSDDHNINDQQQMKIKVDEDKLPGNYANQAIIMHSKDEFIIDFVAAIPPEPALASRVILAPGHFKRIVTALTEHLKNYENQHGEITVSHDPVHPGGTGSVH